MLFAERYQFISVSISIEFVICLQNFEPFVVRYLKGTLYSPDRMESDNRVEVALLKGLAKSNLPYIV